METTDLQMVMVIWADAHSGGEGWTPRGELGFDGEYLVRSIGWLLPAGEGGKEAHTSITQSITPHDDIDHIIHIPQGMVRKVTFLHAFSKELSV